MLNTGESSIERFRKTAKEAIDKFTDDQIGEMFRKYFDPQEPSPDIAQEDIAKMVDEWLDRKL